MSMVKVTHNGTEYEVTAEQKKIYDALPAELQTKLKAPVNGGQLGDEELAVATGGKLDPSKPASQQSTIMCAF